MLLAVIVQFGLGCWGVDRCFLGQYAIGGAKCLTCGGCCGILVIVDYIVIAVNCLQKKKALDAIGMQAKFNDSDISGAFWVTVVGMIVHWCLSSCTGGAF